LFPAREDLLTTEPFTDPFYNHLIPGLQSGRSFHSSPAWGKVEDLLLYTLSRLWEIVTTESQIDLPGIVEQRTEDLKSRVELILESYDQQR